MVAAPKSLATAETLIDLGDEPFEVLAGELVRKADPTAEHSRAQTTVTITIGGQFSRRVGGPDGPGGWWLHTEIDVELSTHDIVRPDIAGWRREHVPEPLKGRPVRIRPDWICEIVSKSNARRDTKEKLELYRRSGIPHYWLVEPERETLTVYRLTPDGYLVALTAGRADVVRAEPFDAIELRVGTLFGDD